MPKKPARNAFYFFMKDIEPGLRKEGRVFHNGIQDVVPIAHPRWKALPESERNRYEKIAKEYKAKMRGSEGDKYRMDNVGEIIANRRNPVQDAEKRVQKERESVRTKWPHKEGVRDEVFYFINFQTLCRTEDGDYLPAEVGVIEYSIKKGITRKLHRFIESGRIPTGYRFECKQKSEDYHQIPIENFDKADSNYRGLWIQLENFVNPNGEKPEYPPFYCLGPDREEVCECLKWIHDHACVGYVNRLKKVYQLEGMVCDLYDHIESPISKASVIDLLTSISWDYEPKTRCDFHEELECKYCALGIVQRYAYALSDSLCPLMEVRITEKHLPVRPENAVSCRVLPPSTMKMNTKQGSKMPRNNNQSSWGSVSQPKPTHKSSAQARNVASKSAECESSDEDNDEMDINLTSLRRPNIPAYSVPPADPWAEPSPAVSSGGAAWAAPTPAVPSGVAPWSRAPIRPAGPPGLGQSDFPTLGRGMSPVGNFPAPPGLQPVTMNPGLGRGVTIQGAGIGRGTPLSQVGSGDVPQKFAGRANAPDASSAPIPPAAWVQEERKPMMKSISEMLHENKASKPVPQSTAPPPGFSIPQQMSMPQPSLPNRNIGQQMAAAVPNNIETSRVRGRGLLGNINPDIKVPIGRGYAPPGMDINMHMQRLKTGH